MGIAHLGLLSLALLGSPNFTDTTMAGAGMNRPNRTIVSTHDLNLSTAAGVRAARARVRLAAERVCGDYPQVGVLPPVEIVRCRTIATREADARIVALASRANNGDVVMANADSRAR